MMLRYISQTGKKLKKHWDLTMSKIKLFVAQLVCTQTLRIIGGKFRGKVLAAFKGKEIRFQTVTEKEHMADQVLEMLR